MSLYSTIDRAFEQGKGVLRLTPTWVPRSFCIPGRRIKLHPDDYYAFGGIRGGIDERWFSSTTPAQNGPLTSPDEGFSFVVFKDGTSTEKFLLRDAVSQLKGCLLVIESGISMNLGRCIRNFSTTRGLCRIIFTIIKNLHSLLVNLESQRHTISRHR